MKVLVNDCYGGGYSLSEAACRLYYEKKGIPLYEVRHKDQHRDGIYLLITPKWGAAGNGYVMELRRADGSPPFMRGWGAYDIPRSDPTLVEVVEELGLEAASGRMAELAIIEIPDGVDWYISDYDGMENVAERHRTWYVKETK
jgi:hypothetical protein